MPGARKIDVNVPKGIEGSPWILTQACENTIQCPLVDLGDNLAGGEGRIKAVHICGESGNDTGRLESQLESSYAGPEPTAPTGVVPDMILVSPSLLFVHVID